MPDLKLSLVDNALDYVERAIADAAAEDGGSWKYAVLHLFAGIELLIKHRLRREHWSLLFADVDKATEHALRSGEFRSVDFDTCCKRLTQIVGIPFEQDQVQELNALRRLRNRVQHFEVDVTEDQAKAQLVLGLSFCISFVRTHLAELSENERVLRIMEQLPGFRAFLDERMAEIQPELEKATRCWYCPQCCQNTLVLGREQPICLLCRFTQPASDLAMYLDEAAAPEECPECGAPTRILHLLNNEEGGWLCTNCGDYGLHTTCHMCGCELEDASGVCDACFPKQLERLQRAMPVRGPRENK